GESVAEVAGSELHDAAGRKARRLAGYRQNLLPPPVERRQQRLRGRVGSAEVLPQHVCGNLELLAFPALEPGGEANSAAEYDRPDLFCKLRRHSLVSGKRESVIRTSRSSTLGRSAPPVHPPGRNGTYNRKLSAGTATRNVSLHVPCVPGTIA